MFSHVLNCQRIKNTGSLNSTAIGDVDEALWYVVDDFFHRSNLTILKLTQVSQPEHSAKPFLQAASLASLSGTATGLNWERERLHLGMHFDQYSQAVLLQV